MAADKLVDEAENVDNVSDGLEEFAKDAAAAVAATALLNVDEVLAAARVVVLEVKRAKREVFPLPTPTAGTPPVSFAPAEVDIGPDVEDAEAEEISVLLVAVAATVV